MTSLASSVVAEMRSLGNSSLAVKQRAYHKSNRVHFGLTVPQCTDIARRVCAPLSSQETIALATALWDTHLFDPMICAQKMLRKPSIEVWNLIVRMMEQIDGWALTDNLAPIAGRILTAMPHLLDTVETWTTHPSFWYRRAALVFTLPYAKPPQSPERMLGWASSYTTDREWFIQKAIGWWLRTLAPHNPDRVRAFLTDHPLKGVALREATRKLP